MTDVKPRPTGSNSIIGRSRCDSAASRTSRHHRQATSCRNTRHPCSVPLFYFTHLVIIILFCGVCRLSTSQHGFPRASCLRKSCHGFRYRVMDRQLTRSQGLLSSTTELRPAMSTVFRISQGLARKPASCGARQMHSALAAAPSAYLQGQRSQHSASTATFTSKKIWQYRYLDWH